MRVPEKDYVEATLSRIQPVLRNVVIGAWEDWLGSTEAGRSVYNRTRACIVWERMVARATEQFSDDPGVIVTEGHETKTFVCDEAVLFRFKKGDERGLSRNVATELAMAYHDHDRDLFGDKALQRVDVVYVLNSLETAIESIQVVGRNGPSVAWSYDIIALDEPVDLGPRIEEVSPAPSGATKNLVRAKKPAAKTGRENK